jgi:hypothetical protein
LKNICSLLIDPVSPMWMQVTSSATQIFSAQAVRARISCNAQPVPKRALELGPRKGGFHGNNTESHDRAGA